MRSLQNPSGVFAGEKSEDRRLGYFDRMNKMYRMMLVVGVSWCRSRSPDRRWERIVDRGIDSYRRIKSEDGRVR